MPSMPPPGWAEDQVAPTIPPPSYDESKGFPSNPPPPPVPRDSNLGLPAALRPSTMPTLSTEAAIGLTEATAILSGSRSTSQAVSSEVDQVMQQLDGIKSGSTIATYADLGLGTAAEVLNNAGLLDAYVVACKAAPVVQGASTALAVLDGVKAVYDHQKIGGDIERLQGELNNAQKMKMVAKFVGHDDLLRSVDRTAMIDRFLVDVLEGAQTDKELDALKAGLETAAGISGLTGALTGGAGLAVGAALELTSLAVSGGRMVAEKHKLNEAEESRVDVDRDLASKYLHKWAQKVGGRATQREPVS